MGWEAANGQQWLPSGHSSGIESVQMRGSVVGQAQQAHCVTWLDPIDDGEMVQQSVAKWTAARVWANMWDQYCMNGSFHGRVANYGQEQDYCEHGQNCGS